MENELMILPDEVKELAVKVSAEKQKEVYNVLTQIFAGTADWEHQVDLIEVKDINDRMSIQLADVARKNAKSARLVAEKIFDAKRDAVQMEMQNYKLEDSLWLKSKQIMQLKFKAIEEKAEWKAKFVERYEAEQKELKTQIRIEKIIKFMPEYNRLEISNMSDDYFNMFLAGLEKTYNDKIEVDRKAEEKRLKEIEIEKARQEKIRLENIRLQKEAKQRELQIAAEREQVRKDNEEHERLAEIERKKQAKILTDQKAEAVRKEVELRKKADEERKERERLAKEIQDKKDADRKAEERKIAEEKKLAKAPDKIKLVALSELIGKIEMPVVKSDEAKKIVENTLILLQKTVTYLLEKSETL